MNHGFWYGMALTLAWVVSIGMMYLSPMADRPRYNDQVTDLGEEPIDG